MKATACFAAIFLAAWALAGSALRAAPLNSATVMEIKNDVKIGKETEAERAAAVKDTVAGKDRLWTGKKSRVELEFTDKSIARLGANTHFSFDPKSRDMTVKRGTALIHVPPGKDGARISSPSATAAITGDVVAMRVDGRGVTQIVALTQDAEGPIQVTIHKTGETRALRAGEMMTIDPMATKMPEPLTVAVDVFVQSSGLAGGFKAELPASAQSEIKQTEILQAEEIQSGNLEAAGELVVKSDGETTIQSEDGETTTPSEDGEAPPQSEDGETLTQSENGEGAIQPDNGETIIQPDDGNTLVLSNDVDAIMQSACVETTTVQAGTVSNLIGRYVGTSEVTSDGNGPDNLTLDIREDGAFSVTLVRTFDGHTSTGTGSIGNDGSFTVQTDDGGTVTGTVQIGATTASGNFTAPNANPPPPDVSGTFNASKQ